MLPIHSETRRAYCRARCGHW